MDNSQLYIPGDDEKRPHFVLAYVIDAKDKIRSSFQCELRKKGLKLELVQKDDIGFVKIHVPKRILPKYIELLKLRMPMENDETENKNKKNKLSAEYRRDMDYLFVKDSKEFYSESVRIAVAWFILERCTYYQDDHVQKGIKKLLAENVYDAAYPLHNDTTRNNLLSTWAKVSKFTKSQPIDDIKEYFGVKFALYFIWLGFYTRMLIPASIVGLVSIIYAASAVSTDDIIEDMCDNEIIMCPRCDKFCDYWTLNDGCLYSKIQHFIDNPATIFFAVFMSFWAGLYFELWKRYSAEVLHRWGLNDLDLQSEPPRPEYLAKYSKVGKTKNVITREEEPKVSFWKHQLPSILISFSFALIWLCVVLTVVVAIIVYRMSMIATEIFYDNTDMAQDYGEYFIYIMPVTTAILNLVCIQALDFIYEKLAKRLTDFEALRTQTQYDDSLALKLYMFKFLNLYSSLFYIAFLKGKFIGYPGDYNLVFGFRQEECNPGGCMMELTIQLAIIMIGQQALNAVIEMGWPYINKKFKIKLRLKKLKNRCLRKNLETESNIYENKSKSKSDEQFFKDYELSPVDSQSLFPEYLEMVLQYGFITIFVTAFPLAPIFALLNNILEMRLDAKKFLKYYRRPVPQRVKKIGIWLKVTTLVGNLAVVSNAFIIAFSSNFIPKLVYKLLVSNDKSDDGYVEYSLSYFNTSDFMPGTEPKTSSFKNISICRYADYRNPPWDENKYKPTSMYWHIMTARLAFVVVYQNFVMFIMKLVDWVIPDMSKDLKNLIKKEAYETERIMIEKAQESAIQKSEDDYD